MQKKLSAKVAKAEKVKSTEELSKFLKSWERCPTLTNLSSKRGIDVAFEQKEFISNIRKPTSGMRFRPDF
ncbi:hypothetical protein [Rufibacter sp. XAAS-G3-1]|uniref:hypothetical protein n=1 Tax=Rufibacter sp. XAAS-G3-1 TaxID=2729134 RepID=UPI0015E712FC|nr:hypothetical protein [Rufibacter sp. XAAS-G3-1]